MLKRLYEDKHLLLCVKPAGLLSQSAPGGGEDVLGVLRAETGGEIFPIHRLDRGVGGCMVFAKTQAMAGKLSALVSNRELEKTYLAVVEGVPAEQSAVLRDLLFRDAAKNKTFVVGRPRAGVKQAELDYETLGSAETERGTLSLLRVRLHTGRTHQIRCQFASRRLPVYGDGKYGSRENRSALALWSFSLAFTHPFQKRKRIACSALPPAEEPWTRFDLSALALQEK